MNSTYANRMGVYSNARYTNRTGTEPPHSNSTCVNGTGVYSNARYTDGTSFPSS